MHFRYEHEFEIDAGPYWDLFFDDEYVADLFRRLKMKEFRILEKKDDGKTLHRVVRLLPSIEVPQIFRSVISDMSYTEHDLFDRARSAMEVRIEPALLKNKFDFKGVYSVQPLGPGRCRRVFEGDCKVSILLLGGQIEKYMVEQVKVSYNVAARVTAEWIAKRKA